MQFQAGKRVQIKILRISDRGEHTSQISRDCHQDDQITDSRFHTGHLQDQDAEWHKGDEATSLVMNILLTKHKNTRTRESPRLEEVRESRRFPMYGKKLASRSPSTMSIRQKSKIRV